MHDLIEFGTAKGEGPIGVCHREQLRFWLLMVRLSGLHLRESLLEALRNQSDENSLFVVKVLVDGGLAVFNALSDFAGSDRLPALLDGNLTGSRENALPNLLPFPFPSLLDTHYKTFL